MIKKRYGERNIYLSDSAEKASAVTTTAVAVQPPVVESDVVKSISADGKILTPGDGVGGQIKRLHSLAYNNTLNTFRSFAGRTVIDKRQGTYISYRVLRAVAEKAFLINIIITHTNRIIAPFCKVSTRNNERGFKIRLKDSSKVPTDEEKARMRELEDFFFNTGFDKNKDRGNLISFIKKGNRDLLTLDQICTEKQRTKDGRLYAFWTVDPATISKVTVCEEDELLPERDRVKYVQEVDMHDVAFFTDKDLEFDIMNPRSDIEHSMYGYSYVEQAMDLISGMIKSFTYNMGNFDSDNLPRGMLLLNGDPDPGTVEAFEEYIVSVMSSPADKWRIPLIPSGSDGSSIQWLSLQSKNKDMEFGEWTSRLWASVAALFGVDLEELGIRLNGQTSVIPENPEARIVNSRSRILGDLLSFWDTHLQNILDEIDDKYDFEFVGYEVDDIRKKDESRKARLETIMSINELRAEEDLKPIDDPLCDTPLNPQLVILKGQQGGKMDESSVVDDEETGEEGGDDDDPSPDKPRGGSSPENTQEDEPDGEDNLEKSMSADNFKKSERGSHKYIYKYFKDGQWRYVYEVPDPPLEGESRSQRRIRLAKDLKPITGVNPLDVDGSNFTEVGKREYERLMQLFDRNKITCPALGNRRVVMISNLINHLYYKGKVERDIEEIINRIRVMPFIPSIIQGEKDYTKLIDVQKRSDKNYYEILGKGSIGNKEFAISVILTDTNKDDVLYISIFSNEIKENRKPRSPRPLRKSASRAKAVVTPCIEAVELPVLFQPAFGTATCDSSNYGNYSQESGESQEPITKSVGKKYVYKYFKDGQWRYVYPEDLTPNRRPNESEFDYVHRIAAYLRPVKRGFEIEKVTSENYYKVGQEYFNKLREILNNKNRGYCPALNGRKVFVSRAQVNHLFHKGTEKRAEKEIIQRIKAISYIIPIIEGEAGTETVVVSVRQNKRDSRKHDYELIGRGEIDGEDSIISVIVTDSKGFNKKDNLLYISVFTSKIEMGKGVTPGGWVRKSATATYRMIIPCVTVRSYHKQHPYSGIPGTASASVNTPFPDTHCNSTFKSGESQVLLKGKAEKEVERPAYKMLEDVQDGLCRHFTMTLNVIYKTLCRYLGLPEVSETMLKSRGNEEEPLILNGRVIFSPETGEPLKNRDWQRLINAIEKYIGRKMSDQDQRLVMQNAAVAKIISHLLKNNTREAIEKLRLESVDKKVGFYRATESWKRLKEAFPDLSAADIDRLEFARDNIGNYISSVGADVVKKIKEVYYQAVTGKKDKGAISQELFDWFGDLNRNYERIVKTESNNITNRELIREGLRGAADGEPVYFKRYEGSANICPFCRDANGVIARWSDKPMDNDQCDDGTASVWIWNGKSNFGRKGSQMWYAAESFHPNCQGIWERYYP